MRQMSFLPEPKYNPRWPTANTLARKALDMLLMRKHISHPQFEAQTGSWRLAAHVHILKKLGWPVQTEHRDMEGFDEEARDRFYSVYYLPDELLELMAGV